MPSAGPPMPGDFGSRVDFSYYHPPTEDSFDEILFSYCAEVEGILIAVVFDIPVLDIPVIEVCRCS